ncbi:CD3324 family protein [[Eubacterium] hominis]|uniref:CD3324 family protein n=1 Tax=[Eubacterium] hominis TaxID=2764325 RepID=UPI003A4D6667
MKYVNAADVLPKELLKELSAYAGGKLLYVPSSEKKKPWGSKSGSKKYYEQRNQNIVELYLNGVNMIELSNRFGLSYDSIRKIVKENK